MCAQLCGVSALPRNALVEVQMTVRVKEPWTERVLSAEPTHSVWDRSLKPRLRIEPGDEVQMSASMQVADSAPGTTLAEYLSIDRTRIHALTGPIWIEGAEPAMYCKSMCWRRAMAAGLEQCGGGGSDS